jgi:HEPN domain-containing protein
MKNASLVADYIKRCRARLKGLNTLYDEKAWADVVRESQEVVELALKALLRFSLIEVPRIHDVSDVLEKNVTLLPVSTHANLARMSQISRSLRRDRELAFYGSEDLTPSEFYKEADAQQARQDAGWVVEQVSDACSSQST